MALPQDSAPTSPLGPDAETATLPRGTRIGAVVSSYHAGITGRMLASARKELVARGLAEQDLLVVEAPGAFELALVARRLAVRDDVDAVLCFGLVLKGETSHDLHVAQSAAHGILRASLDTDKPILFGVLTCDTLAQAEARALSASEGGRHDKGRETAHAAIGALLALRRAATIGREERPAGFSAAREGGPFGQRGAP